MKKTHGPEGIRVWQGYRAERYLNNRDQFIDSLGRSFIPATAQMMEPNGLLSYFPTILPESNFSLPDDIALIAYSAQDTYLQAMENTATGKAYSALHQDFYNLSNSEHIPKSKSAFPIKFEKTINFGQPYYLCDDQINWRDNKTYIYCAKRLAHISSEAMREHISKIILIWQKQNINVNGSIIVCEQDYVLYWEHSMFWDNSRTLSALFPFFAPVLEQPLISGKPMLRSVPPLNAFDYSGISLEPEASLDIRLIETSPRKILSPISIEKYS